MLLSAVALGLIVATRGLMPFSILKGGAEGSTRKSVFQGPYAEGRKLMDLPEAADVACELSPLDAPGQVDVIVRARDISKARAAISTRAR